MSVRRVVLPVPAAHEVRRYLLSASATVLAIYLAWLVREIWLPLGLAFILATVLDPVVDRMENRGWKRGPATIFIFIAFLAILAILLYLLVPVLYHEGALIQEQFRRYFPDTTRKGLQSAFNQLGVPQALATIGVGAFESIQTGILRSSSWLTAYGMSFLTNLIWVVIVPIVAFYALRDYHLILGKALLLVPRQRREMAQAYLVEVSGVFAKYLRGLAIVSALNGVATWLLLFALRVPSALVLGLLAGVLYSVPYVGALITVLLTAAGAFIGGGVPTMVWAVGLSVVLHQVIFDQIVTPRILGGQVGLHPILSIIALLAGNLLLGIIGMILAVPVAACIQIGVLALIPKLRLEVEVNPTPHDPNARTLSEITDEIRTSHSRIDDSAGVDNSVRTAVSDIDAATP